MSSIPWREGHREESQQVTHFRPVRLPGLHIPMLLRRRNVLAIDHVGWGRGVYEHIGLRPSRSCSTRQRLTASASMPPLSLLGYLRRSMTTTALPCRILEDSGTGCRQIMGVIIRETVPNAVITLYNQVILRSGVCCLLTASIGRFREREMMALGQGRMGIWVGFSGMPALPRLLQGLSL